MDASLVSSTVSTDFLSVEVNSILEKFKNSSPIHIGLAAVGEELGLLLVLGTSLGGFLLHGFNLRLDTSEVLVVLGSEAGHLASAVVVH